MLVMGLMSGTSADGIDVALASVKGAPPLLKGELLAHATMPIQVGVRKEVLRIAEGGISTAREISQLNFRVGEEFAAAAIAACTGIPTVGDFRVADVAAGGQGAPLVPYVDALLFRDERIGRVALNLGGIGNVTVLARRAGLGRVLAFDTGPGNMVIDALVTHFTKGRTRFD